MKLNITLTVAKLLLIAASIAVASPGGPRPGHNHGPGHDHGPGGHDHGPRRGHDHGPGRDHDHGRPGRPTYPNEIATLEPGRCSKIISTTVTAMQSYQTQRRVATKTRCGWLHLAHCRKYRLTPHVAYRQVTKLVYVNVRKCCVGFMEVNGVCEPQGGRTLPPPTTVITAPPAPTTPKDDKVPDDEMMMIDNSMQKFVFFIIVLIAILITGAVIGGVIVHLCGGRKEVMRRISTRRFNRKTRKETTKDQHGKASAQTPKDDPPPRYESFNKPVTSKVGVAFHHHGNHDHHDHAHKHAHDHTHGHTHDHAYGHAHKASRPTAPPYNDEYENVGADINVRPKVALPGNGVQAKSCDSQAGYVEIYESEPVPVKTGQN